MHALAVHAQGLHLFEAVDGCAGKQELHHFVEQARQRFFGQQVQAFGNRRGGVGGYLKTEFAGKPGGAQHAHRVFLIARAGVADHHQAFGADVGHAVVEIGDFPAGRVVIQGVAGEIAAGSVLLHAAVAVVLHDAAVFVLPRGAAAAAEGGDFNRFRPHHHVHNLKAAADDAAAAEYFAHFFRTGVGGYVEIFRLDAQKQIAHRAAHHISLKPGLLQPRHHLFRRIADPVRRDAVFVLRQHLFVRMRCGGFRFARQDFAQPFSQHRGYSLLVFQVACGVHAGACLK